MFVLLSGRRSCPRFADTRSTQPLASIIPTPKRMCLSVIAGKGREHNCGTYSTRNNHQLQTLQYEQPLMHPDGHPMIHPSQHPLSQPIKQPGSQPSRHVAAERPVPRSGTPVSPARCNALFRSSSMMLFLLFDTGGCDCR